MIFVFDYDRIITVKDFEITGNTCNLIDPNVAVIINKYLYSNSLEKQKNAELAKHPNLIDFRGFAELNENDFSKKIQNYMNNDYVRFTIGDSVIQVANWHIKGIKFFTGTEVFILDALKNPVAEIVNRLKNNPESVDISDLIV